MTPLARRAPRGAARNELGPVVVPSAFERGRPVASGSRSAPTVDCDASAAGPERPQSRASTRGPRPARVGPKDGATTAVAHETAVLKCCSDGVGLADLNRQPLDLKAVRGHSAPCGVARYELVQALCRAAGPGLARVTLGRPVSSSVDERMTGRTSVRFHALMTRRSAPQRLHRVASCTMLLGRGTRFGCGVGPMIGGLTCVGHA